MDLLKAWTIFVAVGERGSFTQGAAEARVPQSVASRRIAALEEHLGEQLFDRNARAAALTPFGHDLLPSARRLINLAQEIEYQAERALLSPLTMAVPDTCATPDLARLDVAARRAGVRLDFRPTPSGQRAELVRSREVRAALLAVRADEGIWAVPLGLASAVEPAARTVYIETLRVGRTRRSDPHRRIWMQPEDDIPHLRDRMFQLRDALGLRPEQVTVASSPVAAAGEVLDSTDLLLCSPRQAADLGLHWRSIGEVKLVRGYDVYAAAKNHAELLRTELWPAVAHCLGASPQDSEPDRGDRGR